MHTKQIQYITIRPFTTVEALCTMHETELLGMSLARLFCSNTKDGTEVSPAGWLYSYICSESWIVTTQVY